MSFCAPSNRGEPYLLLSMPGGGEFLRVEPSGEVFVRGEKVDSDRKVYECLREWFGVAMPGRL